MKKILFIVSFLFINFIVNGQELTGFMGIPFGTTKEDVKSKFLAKTEGAIIHTDEPGMLTFTNVKFGGRDALAILFSFNEENQFHTAIVLLNNEDEYEVFNLFDNVVKDINSKYHYRDVNNEIWRYPYEASDKYQHGTTAMKLGKCKLQTMWYFDANDPNTHDDDNVIAVENTEFCKVKITYQNGIMINNVINKKNEKSSQDY